MFYLEVSISYMKMAVFLGAAKYVLGLLWHSSIWNFLMKKKNQAHEELIMNFFPVNDSQLATRGQNTCIMSAETLYITLSIVVTQLLMTKKNQNYTIFA